MNNTEIANKIAEDDENQEDAHGKLIDIQHYIIKALDAKDDVWAAGNKTSKGYFYGRGCKTRSIWLPYK